MSRDQSPSVSRAPVPGGAPLATVLSLPGLRTVRSPGFRRLVAATLCLTGAVVLALLLVHQASDPAGQYGIDFSDYQLAAQRMAAGASPYAAALLQGPITAQGVDVYRYPPLFAQLLLPLANAPFGVAATIWLLLQAAAAFAAVWIAAGLGGARRSLERALWCAAAAIWFLPVFDSLWKGNVSDILALQVALLGAGGLAGGAAMATAVLLKVVPVALLPAIVRGPRRALITAAAVGGVLLAVSVLAAPGAWLDYARVLPNLAAGSADDSTNLAPWALVARLGVPALATVARLASILLAGACVVAAWRVARRAPAAAVALTTIAMLLLPAALWYHYLAVLLPQAALAWPRATGRARAALAGCAALISLGIAWLPLATLGAAALATVLVAVLLSGATSPCLAAPTRRAPRVPA